MVKNDGLEIELKLDFFETGPGLSRCHPDFKSAASTSTSASFFMKPSSSLSSFSQAPLSPNLNMSLTEIEPSLPKVTLAGIDVDLETASPVDLMTSNSGSWSKKSPLLISAASVSAVSVSVVALSLILYKSFIFSVRRSHPNVASSDTIEIDAKFAVTDRSGGSRISYSGSTRACQTSHTTPVQLF